VSLDGKVVIVTGSGSGIGRATAVLLASEGAKVVVSEINPESGEAVSVEIHRTGGSALFVPTDVSNETSVGRMIEKTLSVWGNLYGLVNNAGVYTTIDLAEMPPSDWDRVLAVNLGSVFLCSRAVLGHLRPRREGSIVNIASVHAHFAFSGNSAYDASKGGIVALTRTLALENGPFGIRANVICPGYIDTAMWDEWLESIPNPEEMDRMTHEWHPLKRRGTPLDVAKAVRFFLSEDSAWITGTSLTVDGGLSIRYFGY
jgi:NAD(P)-dependent dehydrogenase (short-subunit alcohol dehydrogenase family)